MTSNPSNSPVAAASPQDVPQVPETATNEKHTYGQILKSSALIGGSSVVNIAIGIVRTKAMAVFLGPAGFGLMGVYGSIADLAQSIAGMGINSSGVRQIAEAVGTGEKEHIARTAVVLRRTSVILGILGAVLLLAFSGPVSTLTFGNDQHTAAVALLSLAVFFRLVSAGQGALIQGMRRISDLAKMGMLGALYGTIISIPMVYFLRYKGVVPALIAIAAMSVITSWWYSRKVEIAPPALTVSQVRQEAASLLKLGFAFMASGFLMMGAAYAVRTMVLRMVGFEAAGFYSAAWTLGGLYVGFILQAMGADFYPRLTAVAKDNAECNRLVNEQALISLLLAGPGVIATLTFASLVITLFYSARFDGGRGNPAVDLSRHGPPRDHLADGVHHSGKRGGKGLFLDRTGLDRRQPWPLVGMYYIFWSERRGDSLLRVLRISRPHDLPDCSSDQRVSMVSHKYEDRHALCLHDCARFLCVSCFFSFLVNDRRNIGGYSERCLLDSQSRLYAFPGLSSLFCPALACRSAFKP